MDLNFLEGEFSNTIGENKVSYFIIYRQTMTRYWETYEVGIYEKYISLYYTKIRD